jgi:hypothetical protein
MRYILEMLLKPLYYLLCAIVCYYVVKRYTNDNVMQKAVMVAFPFAFITLYILDKCLSQYDCWRPIRPKCRRGKCKVYHYRFEEMLPDGVVFRCKCGDRYFLTKNRRFMELLSDGSKKPYMKRKRFGKWEVDHSQAHLGGNKSDDAIL